VSPLNGNKILTSQEGARTPSLSLCQLLYYLNFSQDSSLLNYKSGDDNSIFFQSTSPLILINIHQYLKVNF